MVAMGADLFISHFKHVGARFVYPQEVAKRPPPKRGGRFSQAVSRHACPSRMARLSAAIALRAAVAAFRCV